MREKSSFSSKDTIETMLTQKNRKGYELSISFMSKELHDYELRYLPLEKQYFALVGAISHFKPCILSSLVKAYVPHPLAKMLLSQPFREGRQANWLGKLQ